MEVFMKKVSNLFLCVTLAATLGSQDLYAAHKFFTILSTAFLLQQPLVSANPIIITHGFNAKNAEWYQPGGDFFNSVNQTATEQGHEVSHFSWDQPLLWGASHYEHRIAGFKLAERILDLNKQSHEEVILIAHSYGGLVAYRASDLVHTFNTNRADFEKERLTVSILELLSKLTPKNLMRKNLRSLPHLTYKKASQISQLCLNFLKTQFNRVPSPLNNRASTTHPIKMLFTLGTPHQPKDPKPNMNTIDHLYNLNSHGDFVANGLAGSGDFPGEQTEHTHNVRVMLPGSDIWPKLGWGPGHSGIHHPIIGNQLLTIPKIIGNKNNGKITFYKNGINFEPSRDGLRRDMGSFSY